MSNNINDDNINFLLEMRYNIEDFLNFLNDFNDYLLKIDYNKCNSNNKNIHDTFINIYNENIIKNKIQNLHNIINKINTKICKDCNHEFIEDYIDDFLDRTQKINYCGICFLQN